MTTTQTELAHASAKDLDLRTPHDALTILARAQSDAAQVVQEAVPAIAEAAELAARCSANGGRLIYAAAGSSGLMALFFQAEDRIRDGRVTGVQTCALPIWKRASVTGTPPMKSGQPYQAPCRIS